MSIRKRTLPSGQLRWLVDYVDQQGVRRARQFKTEKEAKEHNTTVCGEIRDGTHIADRASITVKKAGALWIDRCQIEDGLESGTIRGYQSHLDLHILPQLGGMRLSRLTRPMVEAFKSTLIKKHSKKLAAKVLISLKAMLSNAMRLGLVGQNVATGVRVKRDNREDQRIRIPDKDQIRALISATSELWPTTAPWRPFMITAIFTGLRSSELRSLTWDCVNFEKRIIEVRKRANYQNRMGPPKSTAGNRTVPLGPLALNTLRQWKLACPKTELNLVFPSQSGGIIMITEPHRKWNDLLEAAGLPRLSYRFHDTRHIAVSLLIEQGWQAKRIQTVIGHASISTTFNVYGSLWASPESDQEAMAQIEARLMRS
jgi:integrase